MNRQQRRLAERNNKKKKEQPLKYTQGMAIATGAYDKGYDRGRERSATDDANVFMYVFGLVLKTLHEQWGWGYVRLSRLTEQILEEYNNNDMSLEEIQKWCWDYGGFKLQVNEDTK